MVTKNLVSLLKKIKLIVADVDGVFTDGFLYIGEGGSEYKRFHVWDGAGIALLKAVNFPLAVISGRESAATTSRMRELGLTDHLYQGNMAKLEPYRQIKQKFQVSDEEIVFIGDDFADIPVLKKVGVGVAVADAMPEVKKHAKYITQAAGGKGTIREVIELVLKAQDKYETAVQVLTQEKYKDS
jgi:3-deoxy-D-manno-octulosonate 8-phosphate phosphatase (KDO 8-P phosphatase)